MPVSMSASTDCHQSVDIRETTPLDELLGVCRLVDFEGLDRRVLPGVLERQIAHDSYELSGI